MNKLRNMMIAAIAIVGLSTSAFAGSMSLGLKASNMTMDANGTETDRLTAAGANVVDTSVRTLKKSKDATVGTIFVDYTLETRWPISFGVEYTPGEVSLGKQSRTDSELSQTGNGATTALATTRTASAEASNFATAYIEIPLFKGLYVGAGKSNMTVAHANDSGGMAQSSHITGNNTRIGYKHVTGGGLIMKLAYEETDYDTINLRQTNSSVAGNSSGVKANVDTEAYSFSLAKNF